MSEEKQKKQIRRIVTVHNVQGRSIVTEGRFAPSVHTNPNRVGYHLTQLWITDQTPAYVGNEEDPTARLLKLEPPKNGSVVRIIEFGPEGDWLDRINVDDTKVAWGALGTQTASTTKTGKAKHFRW
ncbi:MAG: hypothetical protein EXR35_10465 [Limnohabitans sp.]|nr:hypothetical protein [Limnohabitans sp.]